MMEQIDRRDLDFWRRQLYGHRPMLELPLDHRRTGRPTYEYEEVPFRISTEAQVRVEDLARQQRATMSSLYLAAFALLLSRCGNAREVLIGLPESTGDLCTDLSPSTFIRVDCRPERSFARLVRMIANALATVRRHKAVPLPILGRLLRLQAQPGRGVVCDVCFMGDENTNCVERRRARRSLGRPADRRRRPCAPPCDLGLRICPRGDGTVFSWIYRSDLFDPRSIERMSQQFVQLLQEVVADPQGPCIHGA